MFQDVPELIVIYSFVHDTKHIIITQYLTKAVLCIRQLLLSGKGNMLK